MKTDSVMKSSTKGIAFIVPHRLHDAFAVLFQSSPAITLLAAASTVEKLALQVGDREPDLILLYAVDSADDNRQLSIARLQIAQIKDLWPTTVCVAIISYLASQHEKYKLGADVTLFEGISPDRLLATLAAIEVPLPTLSNSDALAYKPIHSTTDQGGQKHES